MPELFLSLFGRYAPLWILGILGVVIVGIVLVGIYFGK